MLLVGSKDMNTRVYATQAYENLAVHSMAGHLDVVVGAFFENNSMNVSLTLSIIVFLLRPGVFCGACVIGTLG